MEEFREKDGTLKKGHPGYKKKGSKNKTTLLKEERRVIFDAKISQKWEEVIDKLKPEYVADQFLGKAPEILEIAPELKKLLEKANKILPE